MENKNKTYFIPFLVIAALFFVFGFITWSNSQLIPYLKIACELQGPQSYFVATAFFAAYFVMALPSSAVLNKTGFKNGMSLGLLVMAGGALLFVPAANARSYPLFLTGLFVLGSGLTLLQTAANPYATVLGPIESAARRISIMGICNKVAGIVAVIVLGRITLHDSDKVKARLAVLPAREKAIELQALASRVIDPAIFISISLLVLAVVIFFLKLPEINEEEQTDSLQTTAEKQTIFSFPHLWLGAVAIFVYVGVEVISYDTFAGFGEHLGYPLSEAKGFAQYTGYALLAGYLLGIVSIPRLISQRNALFVSCALSIALVLASMFTKGSAAVFCFALLGFSNSVIWPAIWPLAIDKLGRFTKLGSALLIMGIVGGAILPPLYAAFAQQVGSVQKAYVMMIPCYLFILYFASRGHKKRVSA